MSVGIAFFNKILGGRIFLSTNIFVISHKNYRIPTDKIYKPLQVGFGKDIEGFERDNIKDNISSKNKNYCELTGLYWAWKNSNADIKGLVHYRRLFTNGANPFGTLEHKYNKLLDNKTLSKIMDNYDMILPKKRNYFVENLWSHYEHSHKIEGLITTKNAIKKLYPEYLQSFDKVMQRKKAHMFNMLIAKAEIFDNYSNWLFDILFEVEKNIDISNYSPSEARIFGYISELLLDVWLDVNHISYKELPVTFVEGQNYLVKGTKMLRRKILYKGID
ncbi:DUF4422 domain-containing protein [Limosilactobacillus reuteri]|uniref:DUF4422 domain-containing protein n=1 Tax=Limosilactobacillus reuteri TaxID=1598 RepID=UPI000F2DE283|nr:DUF4422 domain-containing protein [Limosilactobacillus reuteri]MCC4384123.1 DUF4422 domain-containing protein [Limosilactobacillus reuteri]MCC4419965.1 DUF4422 domain-containing protein [Limosilactobacillus reuteri]MCC4421297.1 DUF4422 domain-containing protein [Limosilactobacillus reuteri]RNF37144.1 DUF4422 domain-containing protein [Limosilactobacillus reuteri]